MQPAIGVYIVSGGLCCAALGGLGLSAVLRFARAREATGTVVALKLEGAASAAVSYTAALPVVRFTTQDGDTVEAVCAWGIGHRAVDVGQTVALRYRPDAPHRIATRRGLRAQTALGSLFACLGVVLLVLGLRLLLTG